MPVRNHVTKIRGTDNVAKATEQADKKAKSDLKKDVGDKAVADLQKFEKEHFNPNTVLDTEEKRVQAGGKSDEELQKEANEKDKGASTAETGRVTHPATSAAKGGAETTHKTKETK